MQGICTKLLGHVKSTAIGVSLMKVLVSSVVIVNENGKEWVFVHNN